MPHLSKLEEELDMQHMHSLKVLCNPLVTRPTHYHCIMKIQRVRLHFCLSGSTLAATLLIHVEIFPLNHKLFVSAEAVI